MRVAVACAFGMAITSGWTYGSAPTRLSVWMAARPVSSRQAKSMAPLKPSTPWSGVVYLAPPHLRKLNALAAAVSQPSSPHYHHFWTRAEVAKAFSPPKRELSSVKQSLRQEGFRLEGSTGLGLGIRVAGTVGQVDRAWAADLRQNRQGRGVETKPLALSGVLAESVRYISDLAAPAYRTAPMLASRRKPVAVRVASSSHNVSVSAQGPTSVPTGQNILVTVSVVNPTSRYPLKGWDLSANPSPKASLSSYQVSDLNGNLTLNKSGSDVLVLSSSSPYQGPWQIAVSSGNTTYNATISGLSWTGPTVESNNLSPSQVNTAYHAQSLVAAAAKSKGMHIGIFGDSSPTLSDLTTFEKRYHLPQSKVQVIPVDGGESKVVSGWHGELMLDMERSVSSAPGATLDLYLVPPKGSITDTVASAVSQDVVSVFSISAVEPESSISARHLSIWNTLMAEGSLEGITFVAGSGDSGPYGNPNSSTPDVNWPASSTWVTAVGGTQLGLNPTTSAIQSQWAWSPDGLWDSQIDGSGGGYSRIQGVPSWQKGIVGSAATGRGVPDVAFLAAEPYYAAVDRGAWEGMAGTSASTPTWGGWVADMAVLDGRQGFMNPTLYATYRQDPSSFDPVTHGGNAVYQAGPGWNPVTGLGSVVVDRYWQEDAVTSLAVSSRLKQVQVGKPLSVVVQLKNRGGKAASAAGVAVRMASAGPSISINGTAAGLGAVANTNPRGQATFFVVSRQAGKYRLRLSAQIGGRSLIQPKALTATWTATKSASPPFVHAFGLNGLSADSLVNALFPTPPASSTAVITVDPTLSPKLVMATVALAEAVHGPLLFANRHGALASATLIDLRRLKVTRVLLVGNLTASGLGLPQNITIAGKLWNPSIASLFLDVAQTADQDAGHHGVVLLSVRSPLTTQIASVALASHRHLGLLMMGSGKLSTTTLHFLSGQKVLWTIGTPTLSKSDHLRVTDISTRSDLSTLLQVDGLDRAGPGDIVAVNPSLINVPSLAVLTAELAASWPSALVPVGSKAVPETTQTYLSHLLRAHVQNLFTLGVKAPLVAQLAKTLTPLITK